MGGLGGGVSYTKTGGHEYGLGGSTTITGDSYTYAVASDQARSETFPNSVGASGGINVYDHIQYGHRDVGASSHGCVICYLAPTAHRRALGRERPYHG